MRLSQLAICVIAGIAPLIWLPVLPKVTTIGLIIIIASALGFCRRNRYRFGGVILLCFCWSVLSAHQVIWPAQHLTARNQ